MREVADIMPTNNENKSIRQYVLSPAAGKRLIAKSLLYIPTILEALTKKTVVIVAGTTNGYVAEEFLNKIGQASGFSKKRFFRGVTLPTGYKISRSEGSNDENKAESDVVIVKGNWIKGKTIYDVADTLQKGDIVIKGANAVNLSNNEAAVCIGNSAGGTVIAVLQAVIGKRVELFIPVGLEKRISEDISKIAFELNSPRASGPRYMPISGNVITEIEAIKIMTGANAKLVAAGGVCGAEGSVRIAVIGDEEQLDNASALIESVNLEPNFIV